MKTLTNILGALVVALGIAALAVELPDGLSLGASSLETLELTMPEPGSGDTVAEVRQQLEMGQAAWQKFCERSGGNYEYDVETRTPLGAVFETTIVVRHNLIVARKVRVLVSGMRLPNETDSIASYVETLEKKTLRSHPHGAELKTMDDLYGDALEALRQPLRPSELWQCQVDNTTGALLFLDRSPVLGTVFIRPAGNVSHATAPGLSLRQTTVMEYDPQGGPRAPLFKIKDLRPWDGMPVDDVLARSLLERLAISRKAWKKFSEACQRNYEYDVVNHYATGDIGTTTIAIKHGWSISRRWRLVPPPGVDPTTRDKTTQLKLETQIRLLEPNALTIDQIYQRAFSLLEGGLRSHEEWSVSFDDNNQLKSVGYRDRRLGEAAPFIGARIDALRVSPIWQKKYDLDGNNRVDQQELQRARQQKAAGILSPALEE